VVRIAYQVLLRLAARLRDTRRLAVFVGARGADDGAGNTVIAEGVGELSEDHDADTFATGVPVGAVVEGVAFAVGGEKVDVGEPGVRLGGSG
jgi:hypothetical protein